MSYVFQRVSTGGLRVNNDKGVNVLFIPRYMCRELATFLATEEQDAARTDGGL